MEYPFYLEVEMNKPLKQLDCQLNDEFRHKFKEDLRPRLHIKLWLKLLNEFEYSVERIFWDELTMELQDNLQEKYEE